MRKTIIAALLIACWTAESQENRDAIEPSLEARKLSQAAEEFARSVAGERTPHYVKVFEHAIAAAAIPAVSGAPKTPSARTILGVKPGVGYRGMSTDPRYFTNLYDTHAKKVPKIWGGQPVTTGAYPDAVAILGANQLCTGTLITSRVVLTAAHCHYMGINERVVFGNDSSDANATTVEVDRSVPLPNDGDWTKGDLALLFLKSEVTAVAPRLIARPEWIRNARTVRAVGFGNTEQGVSGIKNVVDIVMTSPGCDGTVSLATGPRDDADYYQCGKGIELVAGNIGHGKDTCNGDSGGPIYVDGPDGNLYLAAATSRIVDWEAQAEQPCGDGGIYSRIDTASGWTTSNGVALQFGSAPVNAGARGGTRSSSVGAERIAKMIEQERTLHRPAANERWETALREVASPGTVLRGRIVVAAAGHAVLIPESQPELRIPVMNLPDPGAARDLPVTLTIKERSAEGVEVQDVQLSAAGDFDEKRAVLTPLKYPQLTRIVGEINRSFAEHLRQPGDAETEQSLKGLLREGEMIAALALQRSDRGTDRFRAVKQVYGQLRRTNKAFYDRNDRYPPLAYDRIFRNSRGAVALTRRDDGKPFCSGVLISPQYVMTNKHCADETPSTNVEVRFNYEMNLDDVALPWDGYRVMGYEFAPRSSSPLDVIFLKLERPAVQQDGTPWPAQCMSTNLLSMGSPVYVVGHPRQSFRTVADNAHTLFPFEVTQKDLTTLRGRLIADYEGLDIAALILEKFDTSYKPFPLNQNETVYRYFSVDTNQPTIGIDSDTAEGNSGSPVYSRRSHLVVGLFVAGIAGEHNFDSGFAFHEDVIPMSEIVRQMEEHHPQWTEVTHPCIDGIRDGRKCSCS